MLESMRHYGLEKLQQAGERAEAERRRADYYAGLVARAADSYFSIPTYAIRAELLPEIDNIRATLEWALTSGADILVGQRLAADLGLCIESAMPALECQSWAQRALAASTDTTPRLLRAELWSAVANAQSTLFLHMDANESWMKAMELFEPGDPERRVAKAKMSAGRGMAFTGDPAGGKKLLEEALQTWRALNLPKMIGDCLESLGTVAVIENDIDASRQYYREALPIIQAVGDDRKAGVIFQNKAETEFQAGNVDAALRFNDQSLELDRASKNLGSVANALCNRAAYLVVAGDFDAASIADREALQLAHEAQFATQVLWAVQHAAAIAAGRCDSENAVKLLGFADVRLAELKVIYEFTERQEHDRLRRELPQTLGDERFRTLLQEGGMLNEEAAIALAFRVTQPSASESGAQTTAR